jgi:hypothetical protein
MNKVVNIITKNCKDSAFHYWKSKSSVERIEALEFLRNQTIVFQNDNKGLQRVFRVIERKQG